MTYEYPRDKRLSVLQGDDPPIQSQGFGLNQLRKWFNIPEPKMKKRSCLNCQKDFMSEGAGHRFCGRYTR